MIIAERFEMRNRMAEFLIFQVEEKEDGALVVCRDESIWCAQKAMALIFDVDASAISKRFNYICS